MQLTDSHMNIYNGVYLPHKLASLLAVIEVAVVQRVLGISRLVLTADQAEGAIELKAQNLRNELPEEEIKRDRKRRNRERKAVFIFTWYWISPGACPCRSDSRHQSVLARVAVEAALLHICPAVPNRRSCNP